MLIDSVPFSRPDSFYSGNFYNQSGYHIRYGVMPAAGNERATILMTGAQKSFMEEHYENFRTLSGMGCKTYYFEGYGNGGSDHQYTQDLRKPCTLSTEYHARDLQDFIGMHVTQDKSKPFIHLSNCLGSLISLEYILSTPGMFTSAIMVAPMLGSSLKWINTPEKEEAFIEHANQAHLECTYISRKNVDEEQQWTYEGLMEKYKPSSPSNDPDRHQARAEWLCNYPHLQIGDFTYGNAAVNLKKVREFRESENIRDITIPIKIISPTDDNISSPEAHHSFAKIFKNCTVITVKDAQHMLFREKDEYRDIVFQELDKEISAFKPLNFQPK